MSQPAALALDRSPAGAPSLRLLEGSPEKASQRAPSPRLEVPPYDVRAALALERALGVSHVTSQLLVRRGLSDPTSAADFLAACEGHDPQAFAGIEHATSLIEHHVRAGSRITVHGDYDVDGMCATAIMVRALRSLGAEVSWFIPDRLQDGYGLSRDTVLRLAARGSDLLITVDCAIGAVEEVAAARAAGLDVVVTDHHAPRADGTLPGCPVVHPRVCGYPCPNLCGTGVAFKVAQALGAGGTEQDLELVALATVADVMPLLGENRRLVREGLAVLSGTARPGLRALMESARVDPSAVDAHVLAFRLAPRLNAAGRVRSADAGVELLLTTDAQRAREIAAELEALNAERRAFEQRIVWEAEAQVAQLGERKAYVLWAEDWHQGVIGIVASRIVERYHRPTILIALDEHGVGHGSGRSIPGFDLLGALHGVAGELERYGGHRAAAGLTVAGDRLDSLRAAIETHAEATLTEDQLQPLENVDAVVSGSELGLALAEELTRLEPCGCGNPAPRLLVPGARFGDLRTMGEGRHARFSVSSGGARAAGVAFGCDGSLDVALGEPADATFKLERNVWNGAVEPRLVLRHAWRCDPPPIEVLGEPGEYMAAVLDELEAPVAPAPTEPGPPAQRAELDRRGESPLAVLADALAGGEGTVLAVCADVPRRLSGLCSRIGGFALTSHHALERAAELAAGFEHLVVLDPPACASDQTRLCAGPGFVHWCWGEPELRFAQQMHELEYGLRASLVTLYRSLRSLGSVAGEELEHLLRGEGAHGRPARLAARLIRVLAELELVSLNRDLPALAVAGGAHTLLERSPAYRAYVARYEDGRRYLSSANLRRSD